jgi:hypothetical protein
MNINLILVYLIYMMWDVLSSCVIGWQIYIILILQQVQLNPDEHLGGPGNIGYFLAVGEPCGAHFCAWLSDDAHSGDH